MDVFALLDAIDNLKHLKRTGWVLRQVPEPETVASHMYRMAVLAMTLPTSEGYDPLHCVKMALVHDLGEAIVGDITPKCGVSDKTKFDMEEEAMKKLAGMVPEAVGGEWIALWREYEAAESLNAIAVKQLDKFDMIAQAFSYEQKYGIDLQEFFDSTAQAFRSEPFLTWNHDLRQRREAKKNSAKEL
uniref:5'-deoxynucleotidase HDDC2 n=1 Tax=Steinernema glaseri TaxID=37863 RepID=A0A1I8ASZ0_9BILA